jgi:hypothetical protein
LAHGDITWLTWPGRVSDVQLIKIVLVEVAKWSARGDSRAVSDVLATVFGDKTEATTEEDAPPARPTPFDLLVFPEAILPIADLPTLAEQTRRFRDHFGAVHVGLNGVENGSHLVSTARARRALTELRDVGVATEELDAFENWLAARDDGLWNLAAFIARDETESVRVCLHAKSARSKYEFGSDAETTMSEADTGWVITLSRKTPGTQDINFHLVICSDLTVPPPLGYATEAYDAEGRRFGNSIDIVSAPAATPTSPERWRQGFTDVVIQAVRGFPASHRQATFILANYADLDSPHPAGLSGVWIPRRAGKRLPGFRRVALLRAPSAQKSLLFAPGDNGGPLAFDRNLDDYWLSLEELDKRFKETGFHSSWQAVGTLVMADRASGQPAPTRLCSLSVEVARLRPNADTPGASAARVVELKAAETA